ncbi:MAG: diguanylate cyclase (GGDEF)-like protein/PAS domain S-box-containing protein [Pseudoalteromonas rhizosphaerae]|uniref:Diguanylate cyclase n=6 Tax=Bacteria TaxID=2 RepID=A0ABY3F8G5_9GAMM|nr:MULTISPECIES: diguanylate cyclase [Pseudoalteromonas]MBB1507257.1 diguanylate cyclase [Pseudoalteromonas sp. SG41-1]TVU80340.1 diguanylate cyclase [Pseudoalteromonas neustonica]
MFTLKQKVFLVITLLIASFDFMYIRMNIDLAQQTLHESLVKDSNVLRSSYELVMAKEQENMQAMATFIASDPAVTAIFSKAKDNAEKGGEEALKESAKLRQQLYEKVSPAWKVVQNKFAARQLHFLFGPGAKSYLRVHRPEKFGDNMDDVRHTIVDVNTYKKAVSGFETGRVYSGIRGVVPVFNAGVSAVEKKYIGALEVGSSFNSLVSALDEQLNIGVAVFLSRKHIESIMWQDAIEQRFKNILVNCDCYLEATSRGGIDKIIKSEDKKFDFSDSGIERIQVDGENLMLTFFPLKDYIGKKHPEREAIGAVIFWRNIDKQVESLNETIKYNILLGIFGFLFIEVLIYFAIRFAVNSLEKEVKAQASNLIFSNWEINLSNNIIEKLREGVLVTDENKKIIRVNQAAIDITGYTEQELIGSSPKVLFSNNHNGTFFSQLWDSIQTTGEWVGEIWNKKKNNELLVEAATVMVVKDERGKTRNYLAVFSDVTDKVKHQRYLEEAAFTDSLTKLPNRIVLQQRFEQALKLAKQERQSIYCVFIDLDKFKPINDTFGHDAGDFVLTTLSERMSKTIGAEDTLARIGGDEFVAVINNLNSKQECIELLQKLVQVIKTPMYYNKQKLTLSASFGISIWDYSGINLTVDELLQQADEAMYQAKNSMTSDYIFYGENTQS